MSFFQQLNEATELERTYLLNSPLVQTTLAGQLTLEQYIAFLSQAYFHVMHTVPLLMVCGSRLPTRLEWLRSVVVDYIDDEYGHEKRILNDIDASGGDSETVRKDEPAWATDLMVSYAYDTVMRKNPVGFFGMALVLEGTSIAIANQAGEVMQSALSLPRTAFSYLISHGDIDEGHVKVLESLLNKLTDPEDQQAVTHSAKQFYKLYAEVFRSLPSGEGK